MAKSKNAARQGKKKNSAKQEKKQEEARVTLEALDAMSDSEEDVPEAEYNMNAKAKALRNAIKEGKFEDLIEKLKESAKDGEDEIEEVDLGSSEDEEEADEAVEEMDEEEVEDEHSKEEEEEANEEEEEEEDMNDDAHIKAKEFLGKPEEEEEEDSDEDDENDVNVAKRRKLDENNVFNSKALSVVTEELKAAKAGMPWAETFAVVPPTPLPFGENGDPESNPLDIHDDLKREVSFYNMALEAVKEARDKCKEVNIPFSRPEDFFAEMVKTDDHMAKVKDRLIFETKKMDAVAQRKSNREQKLRAKESQSNKLADKAKRKKDHFKQVEDWANSAASNRGGALRDNDDDDYLARMGGGGVSKKRQIADKKFGFGGKTGRFKQMDRKTLNDTSGFNPRGNFGGMGTKKSAKSPKGAGAERQGKRARDAGRARK